MNLTGTVAAAGPWAYALVFLLTAGETSAFIGLVLPSETVVLFAAALSSRGVLNPFALALTVIAGAIVGDSTGYWIGRLFGRRIDTPRQRRRIRPDGQLAKAAGYLRRRGGPAVFTARYIGFVRSFVPFTAGAARMPYRSFLGYSAAAAFTWGPLNVAAGYFLGAGASRLLRTAGLAGLIAVGALILVLAGAVTWRHHRAQRAIDKPDDEWDGTFDTAPDGSRDGRRDAEHGTDPATEQDPHGTHDTPPTVPGPPRRSPHTAGPAGHPLAGHGAPRRQD